MTNLVTGATGFIGAAVVRRLMSRGEPVRVLVRASSDRRNLVGLDVEIVEGDLTDCASLACAVSECRAVYHVAADYRLWVPDPAEIYRNNVDGSRDLIRAATAAGAKRIVYTSSVATLGHCADGRPANEVTPVAFADMIGHYKRSKYLAEEQVRRLIREEGAPVIIVNPSAPIGPGDVKPTPTGRMVLQAARGRMPAYVDTGLNVVHVDDVAEGHIQALEHGLIGERYILGGHDMALKDILCAIARLTDRRPPRLRVPHCAVVPIAHLSEGLARLGIGEPFTTVDGIRLARKRMFFSSAKAKRQLGYRPRPAELAFVDAIRWFREAGYL